MQPKKRALGRGLDALLTPGSTPKEPIMPVKHIPIYQLKPGVYQPRREMDPAALHELSQSIQQHGLLQPILVRTLSQDEYEIIAGERRWRAAQLAGLSTVASMVYSVTEKEAAAIALIENIQRENLTALEEANAINRLLEEFGLTHQQVAESVGKSRTTITNLLRLMGLHTEVQQLLQRGDIQMGHARALLTLSPQDQLTAARQIVAKDLSVRAIESLVQNWGVAKKINPTHSNETDSNIRQLETTLSEHLGAVVKIAHAKSGKGTVMIYYHSLDALEGVLEHFKFKASG